MNPDQTPAEEYREVAGHFTELVDSVTDPTTWDKPAPPEGWTAREVVGHLVEWFPPFLHQGAGITLPVAPNFHDDPVAGWRTFDNGVQAVLDDPAIANKTFSHPNIGETLLPQAISQYFTADVFMHTWDLARATGQDETLDPERCATMLADMESWDEVLRASGQYGPRIDVPDDSDVQTRFLAFIGRDPTLASPLKFPES